MFDDVTVEKNIASKDRDIYGDRVAMYVQSHIPVKLRMDLISCDVEMLWLQLHPPNLKPILLGCCYRPQGSGSQFLDNLGEMFERACVENKEMYFLGDLNIEFLASNCSLKKGNS